jgi:caprin-1
MGQDNVREDFLAGRNNAIQLTADELKYLDDLYLEVAPKRCTPDDGLPPFADQLTAAAEHLLGIIEGKQKEVVGTNHESLKHLFGKIQDCGYFDQPTVTVMPVLVILLMHLNLDVCNYFILLLNINMCT